jgi:hypothetical protein
VLVWNMETRKVSPGVFSMNVMRYPSGDAQLVTAGLSVTIPVETGRSKIEVRDGTAMLTSEDGDTASQLGSLPDGSVEEKPSALAFISWPGGLAIAIRDTFESSKSYRDNTIPSATTTGTAGKGRSVPVVCMGQSCCAM